MEHTSRPSTSSGRRVATESTIGPSNTENSNILIMREVDGDAFLRIRNYDTLQLESEALKAAETGDIITLRACLSTGLQPRSCRGLFGFTPLHHAARRGHGVIIAELIKAGMLANVRNDEHETSLHLAVCAGRILVIDQLLDYGADVDAVNSNGETALMYAAGRNMPAIVRLLVQRGAIVTLQDSVGETAADHAMYKGHRSILRHLEQLPPQCSSDDRFTADDLLTIFSYLSINDIMRAACVCTKWHRVSEHEQLWKERGVRKWEIALQSSLGFAPTATAMFRPKKQNSKSNLKKK